MRSYGEHKSGARRQLWAPFIWAQMSKKITVLIDGGHLRSYLKRAGKAIDADYIEFE